MRDKMSATTIDDKIYDVYSYSNVGISILPQDRRSLLLIPWSQIKCVMIWLDANDKDDDPNYWTL